MPRPRLLVAIALLVGCSSATQAPPHPQSPPASALGALIDAHGSLACAACHDAEPPLLVQAKCVGCHAFPIDHGLHATARVMSASCWSCHADHRGTGFDARWNGKPIAIDHARVGWALVGAHQAVPCSACHTQRLPRGQPSFVDAPTTCAGCHRAHPPDSLFAQRACTDCHDQLTFGAHHAHATGSVATANQHARAPCVGCHSPSLGAALPSATCESCHEGDPHQTRFAGHGCATCHDANDPWTASARLAYNLHGAWRGMVLHHRVSCRACHTGNTPAEFARVTGGPCLSCHARVHHDAAHPAGKFTEVQCQDCHVAPGSQFP